MEDKKSLFAVWVLGFCFVFCGVGPTYARSCDVVMGNPPINDFKLNSGCQLIVNYNFAQMRSMLCASSVVHSGIITWPSKGKVLSAPLPALLSRATDDKKLFIDAVGQFRIFNDTTKTLIIYCEFSA